MYAHEQKWGRKGGNNNNTKKRYEWIKNTDFYIFPADDAKWQ